MSTSTAAKAEIHNIRDTALWIAGYRAEESERTDAAFHDSYASLLAGELGLAMAREFKHASMMSFAMVVRTVAIDRLIELAIARGADTIVNLGAGLDTRPYRMALPQGLKWIEVDFPDMIEYKKEKLGDAESCCSLEYIAADLMGDKERKPLLESLNSYSSNICAVTEGLIGYLTPEEARMLSVDLYRTPAVQHWIMDYSRSKYRKTNAKKLSKQLQNTPLKFNVLEPIPFFEQDGWKLEENLHILDEADRIGRKLPLTATWQLLFHLMPGRARKIGNSTYGYVMFKK